MTWLSANWFWVLTFIGFIAMHMFGHGGHDGSDRQRGSDAEKDDAQPRVVNTSAGGHQH